MLIRALLSLLFAGVGAADAHAAPTQLTANQISAAAAIAETPGNCTNDGITTRDGRVVAARPYEAMAGFARLAATTGGLGRSYFKVTRLDDVGGVNGAPGTLRAAVSAARNAGGGWIGFAPGLGHGVAIVLAAPLRLTDNITIDGGCVTPRISAPAKASILYLKGVTNVVLMRLALQHSLPRLDGKHGGDCVTVSHGSDRIWIAFNAITRCTDGLVDVTHDHAGLAPMRVTVAHNLFAKHDKAILVSGSDCADPGVGCTGRSMPWQWQSGVQLTLSDNLFFETGQRHPRVSGLALVDFTDNIVAFKAYRRVDGSLGATYGSLVSNGGRLFVRDSLYIPLSNAVQTMAVGTKSRPQAVEALDQSIAMATPAIRIESSSGQDNAQLSETDQGRVPALPYPAAHFGAIDPTAVLARIADRTGPGGWERGGSGVVSPSRHRLPGDP